MEVIIACRVNRKRNPRVLDKYRYKARRLVENFFQRLNVLHRVVTRFYKLNVTFLAFVHIAGTMKWLHCLSEHDLVLMLNAALITYC